MRNDELAQALFEAFGKGDAESVRRLCAPNFEARQNNGPVMTLEPLLEFALAVYQVVKGFRYEDAVRSETRSGFVEEHNVRGTLPDGSELDLAVCVVADSNRLFMWVIASFGLSLSLLGACVTAMYLPVRLQTNGTDVQSC